MSEKRSRVVGEVRAELKAALATRRGQQRPVIQQHSSKQDQLISVTAFLRRMYNTSEFAAKNIAERNKENPEHASPSALAFYEGQAKAFGIAVRELEVFCEELES